jgi:hypothetical protein
MKTLPILRAGFVAALASIPAVTAQSASTDLRFVDRFGLTASRTTEIRYDTTVYSAPLFDVCDVFIDVPTDLPEGQYRIRVKSAENRVVVADYRYYSISYAGGMQSIEPQSGLGVGFGGTGFSIAVGDFETFDFTGAFTAYPCAVKVFLDRLDSSTGAYERLLYSHVAIGDGSGSDVCGLVFNDINGDSQQDAGEGGIGGVQVVLNGGSFTAVTNSDGEYCFPNLPAGTYSISTPAGSYEWSTPTSGSITVGGCCPVDGLIFGRRYRIPSSCEGRTPGYWSGPHGVRYLNQNPLALAGLVLLPLVNEDCTAFDPANARDFSAWLRGRSARNMAYQLSGHLAAMWLNIDSGKASPGCMLNDPQLGSISIDDLMNMASAALGADPCTPSGHPMRASQEVIKNALDRANNNITWN